MSKVNMMSAKDKKKGSLVPRLRFPEFRDEWTYDNLGDFLEEYSEKVNADTTLPIYSSTRDGLKAQKDYFNGHELINSGEYGVVPVNCFVYRHMSDDNIFIFNINLIGEAIAVSKEYPVFKAKNMSPLFLYYILNYGLDFKRFAAMQKKGGTRTRLYFSTLCSWKTLLPTKPEQQRIADCLSSLDERIAAETNKLDALKAHKKGLLKQLFPAEGETLPQLRFPEFQDAGEWEEKNFRNICEKIMDGTHFSPKSKCGPFLYITSKNIQNGLLDLSNASSISEEEHRQIFAKCPVKINDILLTKDGANTGNCALNNLDFEFSLLSSVAVLRCKKGCIIQEFLYYTIASPFFQKKIKESISGQAITRITLEKIGSYRIFSPKEFEQQRIADCLSSLDELITAQSQKIELLKDHKKGLMQQLFPRIDEVRA